MKEEVKSYKTDGIFHDRLKSAVERQSASRNNAEIIDGMLEEISFYYHASRILLIETDWCFGLGVTTHEYCSKGIEPIKHELQHIPMERFPIWAALLKERKPVIFQYSEIKERYPEPFKQKECSNKEYILAAPICRQYNTGFIAVCNPKTNGDDITFLQVMASIIAGELNEVKLRERIDTVMRQISHASESDIFVNSFGGLQIKHKSGVLSDESITADQCYRLLAFLLLNHKKNKSVRELADIIWEESPINDPYRDLKNVVYRLRRFLAPIGLDDFIVGSNGTFLINSRYKLYTDFDKFEDMCIRGLKEANHEAFHRDFHIAKSLYKGGLFPRCDHIHWFIPIISYYQNLYLKLLKKYIEERFSAEDYLLAQKVAIEGLEVEPYDSDLLTYQVICMFKQDNKSLATSYFNRICGQLTEEQKEKICYYRS